jgi:hypothetical protein
MTLAWTTAALHRSKKMPSLDKLLVKIETKRQSVNDMRAALHKILGQPTKKAHA